MQATVSTKGFGFNRFNGVFVAVGLAAVVATGFAGQAMLNDSTTSTGPSAAIVQPKEHHSAGQGEGLISGNVALSAKPVAYDVVTMGEGLVGGNMLTATTLKAHNPAGQGEGIVGGGNDAALKAQVVAHTSMGQGEGWLTNGRPATTATKRTGADYRPEQIR